MMLKAFTQKNSCKWKVELQPVLKTLAELWTNPNTLKMADKERSDFYVVSTVIFCANKLQEALITLLSEFVGLKSKLDTW